MQYIGVIMPLYEFHCSDCNTQFEELVFSHDELPACPKCGSTKTEKLISRPCRNRKGGSGTEIPTMTGQTSSGGGCAGCSGGSCATCGH